MLKKVPLFRLQIVAIVAFLLPSFCYAEQGRRYGLWAEVEGVNQPFKSRENFEEFIRFVEDGGFTDVFCQVYRGGRAWFPSQVVDSSPFRAAEVQGLDPLGETIQRLQHKGVRVHAWINALRIDSNLNATVLKRAGARAVLRDSDHVSLLDYRDYARSPSRGKQLDTPGLWLDASTPEVREVLGEVVEELLLKYPALAGIHLDMIRMPYIMGEMGRGRDLQLFISNGEQGGAARSIKVFTKVELEKLDNLRRDAVTGVVAAVRGAMNRVAPDRELSAAVLGDGNRARDYSYQDWNSWLKTSLIDTAVPMIYQRNNSKARELSLAAANASESGRVLVGLGAWLHLRHPDVLRTQIHDALVVGADGIVLFSYSNLVKPPGPTAIKNLM